jgi:hypothetical protein
MKNTFILTLVIIISSIIISCSSCKKNIDPQVDNPYGLPNATQEGKNTLGFLLNGQPWTPKGQLGTSANLTFYYDATFSAGVFNIGAYRILDNQGSMEKINIFADTIQNAQRISFPTKKLGLIFRNATNTNCDFLTAESTTKVTGFIDIKKLDKVAHIFSGEFEFTLTKTNCDTVKITQGRFDLKF